MSLDMFIPSLVLPIIENGRSLNKNLQNTLKNKNVIIFGVPGAFTPTCSEQHLPGYIKNFQLFLKKKVDEVYCLSVNDPYVMNIWLKKYDKTSNIRGIADGNADLTKFLNLTINKSENYMGIRCKRFVMVIKNNFINKLLIEKPGEFKVSSAENILSII